VTILFMLKRKSLGDVRALLLRWWLQYDRLFLGNSWASFFCCYDSCQRCSALCYIDEGCKSATARSCTGRHRLCRRMPSVYIIERLQLGVVADYEFITM